jgi:IclR family KDG regulon transcriptional repressor
LDRAIGGRLKVNSRLYGTSLLKGLRIMKCFNPEAQQWGITELSQLLHLAKSTVSRIVHSLEIEGFLRRVPGSGKYQLGLVLWGLGNLAFERDKGFADKARPYLDELAARVQESTQTVMLDGLECVYLDKIEAPRSVRPYMSLGARFPAYVSATGQVLLAHEPEATIAALIEQGLRPYTARTITDGDELHRRLSMIREQGYAINDGQYREEVGGFGAPVRDSTGTVIGALGITIPMSRFPARDAYPSVIEILIDVTSRLSREMGYMGPAARSPTKPGARRAREKKRGRASRRP